MGGGLTFHAFVPPKARKVTKGRKGGSRGISISPLTIPLKRPKGGRGPPLETPGEPRRKRQRRRGVFASTQVRPSPGAAPLAPAEKGLRLRRTFDYSPQDSAAKSAPYQGPSLDSLPNPVKRAYIPYGPHTRAASPTDTHTPAVNQIPPLPPYGPPPRLATWGFAILYLTTRSPQTPP